MVNWETNRDICAEAFSPIAWQLTDDVQVV